MGSLNSSQVRANDSDSLTDSILQGRYHRQTSRYSKCIYAFSKVLFKRLKITREENERNKRRKLTAGPDLEGDLRRETTDNQFYQVLLKILHKTKQIEKELLAVAEVTIVNNLLNSRLDRLTHLLKFFDLVPGDFRLYSEDQSQDIGLRSQLVAQKILKLLQEPQSAANQEIDKVMERLMEVMKALTQEHSVMLSSIADTSSIHKALKVSRE